MIVKTACETDGSLTALKENLNRDDPLVYEILYHLHQCRKSAENFFGRDLELRKLRSYVTGDSREPFYIFGKGGSGKTALLSKVCHLVREEWYPSGRYPKQVTGG